MCKNNLWTSLAEEYQQQKLYGKNVFFFFSMNAINFLDCRAVPHSLGLLGVGGGGGRETET